MLSKILGAARLSRSVGLSRQLQALALLLLVGFLVLAGHELIRTRTALLAQTEEHMARLDMVFAEQTGRALESIDLLLQSALDEYRKRPLSGTADEAFRATLARRVAMVRQTLGIAIVDRRGELSDPSPPELARITLPPNIIEMIADAIQHPAGGLRISEPFRRPNGSWTALMIRPAPDNGTPSSVAAIAFLNLLYFEDFYKAVELNENGAIILHRRDGTVLARYPHIDQLVGQSYADLPPFKDILANGMAGTLIMDSPLDGSRRVLAIRALKLFPVAVNVSVSEDKVLKLWRNQAFIFGIACGTVAIITIWLVLLLARRSKERERALDGLRQANEAMTREMEERARVEAALRQAQRAEAIGRLTGGVAHDFNNLLAIVVGNIDLLERILPYDEKIFGRLATMRAAVERGSTLTGQLLAFARRQPLMPRAADLSALVNGFRDLVQSAVGSRIRLQFRLDNSMPPAMVDPAQIELVILNLAINARDAMPEGGALTIETALADVQPHDGEEFQAGPYVVLSVRDTGSGMLPDVAARAFEPFFTTKEVGRGSGLGLSQVYGVARQLGGGARIESTLRQGTAVYVFLPPSSGKVDIIERRPAKPNKVTPAHVLVVDDDHAVRVTTAALLSELGYDVYEAGSGDEALEALECDPPIDVLLTDVVMPGMTGPELARRARLQFPGLPVVFISGYSDPESLSGTAGFSDLVRKPARPEVLVQAIETALSSYTTASAE